ncbi:SDR family NAD(P)-dependent oxidoreductase [Arthrobacter sp. ZGTC212]|uniref:SDR family NAD(P)-dependent oxidoreductase n=1 Tax=Arthrobacter sp. ZGTC212 TaxID=2058899 RepID=UPI000CE479F8|nr:SDR family NAD(P)-dependent oxidoreductase [Arthrobacter sp. ZGTC212]
MMRKTIVITGASDGIGAAAARQLARQGHRVVVVGRSPSKTAAVAGHTGGEYVVADFAALDTVRNLAFQLLARCGVIDVLANNAGAMFGSRRQITEDGHERTFQVNYLAPFLLTQMLTDRLLESGGTVINTSSAANLFGRIDPDDLELEKRYRPFRAYAAAKPALILFTREFDRRYRLRGATSTTFHPGLVATNFLREHGVAPGAGHSPLRHLVLTPDKGARTLVYLAGAVPGQDYATGEYYRRCKVARPNRQARDGALALGLWNRSVAMLES